MAVQDLWVGAGSLATPVYQVFDPADQSGVREGYVRLASVSFGDRPGILHIRELERFIARRNYKRVTDGETVDQIRLIYRRGRARAREAEAMRRRVHTRFKLGGYFEQVLGALLDIDLQLAPSAAFLLLDQRGEFVHASGLADRPAHDTAHELLMYFSPS